MGSMPPSDQLHPSAPVSRRSGSLLLIAGGIILGVGLCVAVLAVLGGRALLRPLLGLTWESKTTVTDSTVVRHIQQLQRLETVVYTLDQIVTEERSTMLPQALAGERILLIVHGDVTAGIDLSRLRAQDVVVRGRAVTIALPPVQIFATRMDNQKTRVYSRDTGLFTSPDPQLETEVRRHAEQQLTAAAMSDGILTTARQNGISTVTALMHSLGFDDVKID
jgi:hypothetical protein